MATSLFKLGRLGTLKCLQQEGWGSVRTPLTAAFCTKSEAPKKPAKKASTVEAPGERAALVAHKTTVAFPTRLSTPGLLSQGVAPGESAQSGKPVTGAAVAAGACTVEPASSTSQVSCEAPSKEHGDATNIKEAKLLTDDSAKAETESFDVGTAADATSPTSADAEAQKDDDATSSSSSSSSDSDSDSDSDDEKPDKTEMTKPTFQTEDQVGQKKIPSAVWEEPPTGMKTKDGKPSVPEGFPKGSPAGAPEGSTVKTSVCSPVEMPIKLAVGAPKVTLEACEPFGKISASCEDKYLTSSEEMVDPAPVLCTTSTIKLQTEGVPDVGELKSSEVSPSIPKLVSKEAPEAAAESTPKVVLGSAIEVASEPKVVEPEAAQDTTEAVAAAEALVDAAPINTEAEVVQAEPDTAAAPEEAPVAPAPEPEPFDNTKYKNLQHHNYNIYTFVDMDVEMAKSRLPQPSTGRPSPMH